IYKEALKFYLNADTEEKQKEICAPTGTGKSQKKDGKISIYVSSPMGENNFKADNKTEFETMKKRLNSLFSLIEEELPNNHTDSETSVHNTDVGDKSGK
ncbi:MAG TPA: hypothetical protein VMV95_04145, partial [Bacillota bacterium]|nr:hypothetical protein [Bacillota bacterium]